MEIRLLGDIMSEVKKTPLAEEHEKLSARMVDFAGWYLPIQYTNIKEEHRIVREKVGLFDVSHMGEVFFRGPKALEELQNMTSNDVSKLTNGKAQYSLILNEEGGIVDDIIIYCLEKDSEYMVCVNAANAEKDFNWFQKYNRGADITNESEHWAQIAVQGRFSPNLMSDIFGSEVKDISFFGFEVRDYHGAKAILARTGYTGEDGYEVFIEREGAVTLWRELLEKGFDYNVAPIGLGARDTLRTEMKFSLYGHEITDATNPYEAQLGWVVKPAKGDFIGKGPAVKFKEEGLKRKLIGFVVEDRGIPRDDYKIYSADGQEIGYVTSGTQSPSLAKAIGIAYVSLGFDSIGQEIFVDIRGRKAKAVVTKTPFVNPKENN